ncbi:MAG: radical SAM protein [Candidatus Adiutrix sp.]|jgi:uncharacterized radical SAM superfamily Fe-S cluster-containing enzyme|nr:radical SAM protein [Candidatus Adiutrix sp.]
MNDTQRSGDSAEPLGPPQADGGEKISTTESLCPVCLAVLPAEIRRRGEDVLLVRECPEHGLFAEAIWRGEPRFESWQRPKSPAAGVKIHREHDRGCPFDCGLCPEHAQHPCTVLFEITSRCNLRCPVCFADSGGDAPFPPLAALAEHLRWVREQAGEVVLQLSGGEPTLHPDLVPLTAEAARLFPGVQLNTNGLRLAEEPGLARRLAGAGLSWVFLQFDGVSDRSFEIIRGRKLLDIKMAAIEACARAGLSVVLAPTVAAQVNDHELGGLLRLAVSLAPTVRGLHIQPMTSAGRNSLTGAAHRLTLPEVLGKLAEQSGGLVQPEQAFPPSCEHERCSFHLRYRRTASGDLIPLSHNNSCCCKTTDAPSSPEETAAGRDRSVAVTLRSWQGPAPLIPMAGAKPDALDEFLAQARRETFSVTCMAFQDAWTADLARLRGCCVHIFRPPNRFLPFCAANLTAADGRALYPRHE